MPRKRRSRVYARTRGGVTRYYGDFRDYADVGGGQEALKAAGTRTATTDPDIAQELATRRLKDLERRRRNKAIIGIEREPGLKKFAAEHLASKARAGKVVKRHLEQIQKQLERAVEHFGANRKLTSITPRDVEQFAAALAARPNGRGGTLSGGTIRHYLNALSNLYRRAQAEGVVLPGFNPVAALMDKPTAKRREARWLEVHEAALLLEAARVYEPPADKHAVPCMYPLLATFLLTGGRKSEVLGLEVDDVSFDRKTVTFRPNDWRRLKTRTSRRVVPLWPQLEEVLREYVFGGEEPLGRLLFPGPRAPRDGEAMIGDFDKSLDRIAERAGWDAGDIRSRMFRHTYTAARLQTLDRGAPVSDYTVARELGHGGFALVRRVYGHLGQIRHRAEVVEYHVDQHRDRLKEQLREMQRRIRSEQAAA